MLSRFQLVITDLIDISTNIFLYFVNIYCRGAYLKLVPLFEYPPPLKIGLFVWSGKFFNDFIRLIGEINEFWHQNLS